MLEPRYASFAAFYPFYLGEHADPTSPRLHVVGTGLALVLVTAAVVRDDWRLGVAAMIAGYGFAWLGHLMFERNRPATFRYPIFSLMGDLKLFIETVTGRRRW